MNNPLGYWISCAVGVMMTLGLGYFVFHSLSDWDFYYRMTTGLNTGKASGFDHERAPALTAFVATNKWILFLPSVCLAVALTVARRKSALFAFAASCSAALVVVMAGYLAAYLIIAKPDWWGDRRPVWIIEEAERQGTAKPESGSREILTPGPHTTGRTGP